MAATTIEPMLQGGVAAPPVAVPAVVAVHPHALAAQCLDHIALEGRAGVAVAALLNAVDPRNDVGLRRQLWRLLQRQHALGVLQFFDNARCDSNDTLQPLAALATDSAQAHIGKKRKRPVGAATTHQPLATNGDPHIETNGASTAPSSGIDNVVQQQQQPLLRSTDAHCDNTNNASIQQHSAAQPPPSTDLPAAAMDPIRATKRIATNQRTSAAATSATTIDQDTNTTFIDQNDGAPLVAIASATLHAMSLDDALARPTATNRATLVVVACHALRLRALNVGATTGLAREHMAILEAVGRTRERGVTITDLAIAIATLDHVASTTLSRPTKQKSSTTAVKRLHSALDTLISNNLVVKRMLIVTRPTMRRLNIVHLPRFASAFTPAMFDARAEFESDDMSKKILCAAAESYVAAVPGQSCVLADLGRDLQLTKRHLEVLRGHVLQEAKRDDPTRLELFQAVLRPTKKNAMEPKILNCIRFKPRGIIDHSDDADAGTGGSTTRRRSGIVMELGLLHQIYSLIDASGPHGATIVAMRQVIGLPGNKLPYKLVAILAGTYGLRAETIIQGKNKAFRLFTTPSIAQMPASPSRHVPLLLTDGAAAAAVDATNGTSGDVFSVRANLALKDALGPALLEAEGTRARRRTHILHRLVREKIISLSSLRASVFTMEKHVAELAESQQQQQQRDASTTQSSAASDAAPTNPSLSRLPPPSSAAVGIVDPRSIQRIAEELERDGALRLLQLPLPARNVSTKFRALKCVVFPGFEHDELCIQRFVKHYCRDERMRRILQNTEPSAVICLRAAGESESENEEDDEEEDDGEEKSAIAMDVDDGREDGDCVGRDAAAGKETIATALTPRGNKRKRHVINSSASATTDASFSTSDQSTNALSSTALVIMPTSLASIASSVATVSVPPISYRIRRFSGQQTNGLHAQQYRDLGFAYGVMYRCKIFHEFLWTHLHTTSGAAAAAIATSDLTDDASSSETPTSDSGIVFSREAVLHAMPVDLYIAVFSGGDVLTPQEFALATDAVATHKRFDELDPTICHKIWSHESKRTAKVLGTLTDLGLLYPHKIGMKSLLKILRAGYSDGRDGVLSRALKDNALGGLFCLHHNAQIVLDDHAATTTMPLQLHSVDGNDGAIDAAAAAPRSVNDLSTIRLVGTTEKRYSFAHVLPLRFAFARACDVAQYWEALECLCLETMVMDVVTPQRHGPSVCEVPKPVKTRARRMLRILAWISKSQKPTPSSKVTGARNRLATATATAAMAGNGPLTESKERRHGIVSKPYMRRSKKRGMELLANDVPPRFEADATRTKKQQQRLEQVRARRRAQRLLAKENDDADDDDEEQDDDDDVPIVRTRNKASPTALVWNDASERHLIELFLANCRSRWHIPVPQGLQRDNESVAFRTPALSRSGFGLVMIARTLGKRGIDVKKRLKEKLLEPTVKLALERTKRDAAAAAHATGKLDEELLIVASVRLTALFRRAVMMVVSPPLEYHPLVAEELISYWSAREIRLVWRYLWLKNWIVRAAERERVRGYTASQRLQDTLKLTTLSYPLWLFRQAAAHESLVTATLEEEAAAAARTSTAEAEAQSSSPPEQLFEAEFPVNAAPGLIALELGYQVLGTCSLLATHASSMLEPDAGPQTPVATVATALPPPRPRKRSLRFVHFKSLETGMGFAAHLAKHVAFQKPSLFLDSWHVETRAHAVTLDDPTQFGAFEAFSTAATMPVIAVEEMEDEMKKQQQRPHKRRKRTAAGDAAADKAKDDERRAQAVIALVRASGDAGVTFDQLQCQFESQQQPHSSASRASRSRTALTQCVDALVDAGDLLYVNAYADQRYVTKEHGDVWLLRPFTLVPSSASYLQSPTVAPPPPRVVFDGDADTLSFPWLKMDGSTNYKFLFSLQRKILALVIASPGIAEPTVFRKLDRLLTLQDTREVLALLVDEGLLYMRGARVRSPTASGTTLFRKSSHRTRCGTDAIVHLTGHALAVDRRKFTVHYFPHIECIQRFGAIVQDHEHDVPLELRRSAQWLQ